MYYSHQFFLPFVGEGIDFHYLNISYLLGYGFGMLAVELGLYEDGAHTLAAAAVYQLL